MKHFLTPTATLALLVLSGCSGLNDAYLRADRATFDAVAPEYRSYVERDAQLDANERQRRLDTLTTWELRLQAAEEDLALQEKE